MLTTTLGPPPRIKGAYRTKCQIRPFITTVTKCEHINRYAIVLGSLGDPPCPIRSDSQTTGLTLTTEVPYSCMNGRVANNIYIHYDVTGLLKKSPESRPNTGAVERLTDLKAKRFLDDIETLSENQQEDLLLLLHGAVGLQGDEGKGKKNKKKGGSDSKTKKRQRLVLARQLMPSVRVILMPQSEKTSPPLPNMVTMIRLHQVRQNHRQGRFYSQ